MKIPPRQPPSNSLSGIRILVADDEIMIALDIEATLLEAGAEVVGPSSTLAETIELIETQMISVATLDIRLGRETTEIAAALLFERGIPFIFYSGQSLPPKMRGRWPQSIVVVKPGDPGLLIEAIERILA